MVWNFINLVNFLIILALIKIIKKEVSSQIKLEFYYLAKSLRIMEFIQNYYFFLFD